ncbi:MAG TPA: LCP family protein [Nocardioidaceae bacterium]|nr:LCP family protein [Nocardioidaceae bacterium]
MTGRTWAARLRRARRVVVLAVVLAFTALVVPPSGVREAPASLVKVESAQEVAHDPHVLWILLLGSDARPGEPVLRSRADAIQLVGVNTLTGAGTAVGIPRDSYVEIPGYGRNRINSALVYGGPQLMARSVGNMVGIQPDYVFTTGFVGFVNMVDVIGGVTVDSEFAFPDAVMPGGYRVGANKLTGYQAMIFSRIRKFLPGGDFDRSANQQRALLGILDKVRSNADEAGFMERGVLSVINNLDTNLAPAELFRLAQAATQISPTKFRTCVVHGGVGYAGAASVVFPDIAQARRIADRARSDATLEGPC